MAKSIREALEAPCDLCGEAVFDMVFKCLLTVEREDGTCQLRMVKGRICFGCWRSYPNDTAIALEILKKRGEEVQLAGESGGGEIE